MPLVFLLSKYQFYLPTPLMITGYVYPQTRLFMQKLKRWRSGIAELARRSSAKDDNCIMMSDISIPGEIMAVQLTVLAPKSYIQEACIHT